MFTACSDVLKETKNQLMQVEGIMLTVPTLLVVIYRFYLEVKCWWVESLYAMRYVCLKADIDLMKLYTVKCAVILSKVSIRM